MKREDTLTHGSLFSGIGGFELGAERAGMMRNGRLYLRQCLDTHTSAKDVSLLPTPCKSDWIGSMNTLNVYVKYYKANHQDKLIYQCHLNGLTPQQCNTIYELVMGFSAGWRNEE